MAYYRLEAIPHFVVKTPTALEDAKRELSQEYENFLRFLLTAHKYVTMHLYSVTTGQRLRMLSGHQVSCSKRRCAECDELDLLSGAREDEQDKVQKVEVGYELPQEHHSFEEYLRNIRRYLRLSRADSPGSSKPESSRYDLKRRVQLVAVGSLDAAQQADLKLLSATDKPYVNLNPKIIGQNNFFNVGVAPLLNLFGSSVRSSLASKIGQAYVMPLPETVKRTPELVRWRHLLSALMLTPGSVTLTCKRHSYTEEDVRYALLCLDYYIGTNSEKLNAQQMDTNTAIQQAVYSKLPIYTVDITVRGQSQILAQAFMRDTDSQAFEGSPNQLEFMTRRGESGTNSPASPTTLSRTLPSPSDRKSLVPRSTVSRTEERSAAQHGSLEPSRTSDHPASLYAKFFLIEELVNIMMPPFTFRDALPGIAHFVPKPFQEPSLGARSSGRAVVLGELESGRQITLPVSALTRHTFITGASGAGKSNTMMNLVRQLNQHKVPVLIIDPVKRDFEPLMGSLGLDNHIWDFDRQWLRFNPFIPPPNITLYAHSVVLAKTFAMLFPTNAVAYEILLAMMKETYLTKLNRGQKAGIPPLTTEAFMKLTGRTLRKHSHVAPTFNEFLDIGIAVLRKSGGEGRPSQWLMDALEHFERRWANMRRSAFSIMLHPRPNPTQTIDFLFSADGSDDGDQASRATTHLLEFGKWFDQNETNAAFALVFSMMYEQRLSDFQDSLAKGQKPAVHVALLDEAHRIVPSHMAGGDERLVSAAKEASTLLTQMIAECRALGQGLIIGEQSASKIDPNVLINTSTKIIHTVLYGKDKEFLSSALSLSPAEQDYLAYLPVGEALAFTSDVYQPLYLRIPEFTTEGK
jgi:hypothetical protein